jgi:hypothetical protein
MIKKKLKFSGYYIKKSINEYETQPFIFEYLTLNLFLQAPFLKLHQESNELTSALNKIND